MVKAPMILPLHLVHNKYGIMKKILIAWTIILCAGTLRCDDENRDPVAVRIFSYYTDFSGSLSVDNGTASVISSESSYNTGTGKTVYYSEYELGEIDALSVSVTTSDTASFLAIRVYKDDAKVKEAVSASVSSLSLTYEYDE